MDKSIREQFADTVSTVGRVDNKLIVLVSDISHGILQNFAEHCPGRYYNIGVCEQALIGISAGLAKLGFHTVSHTISPFIVERAFEQLKLDFCYHKISGNIVTIGSAFDYSTLGSTHHCYGDFALLKTLQNIQIVYPGTAVEHDLLFKQIYDNSYLSYFRITQNGHNYKIDSDKIIFGKGIKIRDGTNLTIIVTAPQLNTAINSLDKLQSLSHDPEIIYIHTIYPLDQDLIINSINKTKNVIVMEEHMENGGLGDDIMRIAIKLENVKYASIAIPNMFFSNYGSYTQLLNTIGLTTEGLVNKVNETFNI